MVFVVDTHIADELGLTGSELLVYSALAYLTKRKAWKGSTYQLAKLRRCGNRNTAQRALERLLAKGLVALTDNGAVMVQNEPNPKKVTKKNIINNSQSLSVSKETDRTDGQTDFDICLNCKFIILLTTKNG